MSDVVYTVFDTPIGTMRVASTAAGICRVLLPDESVEGFLGWLGKTFPQARLTESSEANAQPIGEIVAYLKGQLRDFRSPLDLHGTDFQQAVWAVVARVPYGETRSYADIAREIGRPRACRAVGAANGANPLPLFVPCHRVIGANGTLTGCGGGLALKERLLKMEAGENYLL